MALDSGEYDITEFRFDEGAQELADRTGRRLHAAFARLNVSRDDLYYVAASAVECLVHRRADYMRDLAGITLFTECEKRARIGRVDAHFYFALARSWAVERSICEQAPSRMRGRRFERRALC